MLRGLACSRLAQRIKYYGHVSRFAGSIRVVLLQALEGRGGAGEEVEVRRGFARNYLIPKKIAVYSTELNRTKYIREAVVADLPLQPKSEKPNASKVTRDTAALRDALSEPQLRRLTFYRQVNDKEVLFGSISARNIAEELSRISGIAISEDVIVMPKDTPTFKAVGMYTVEVISADKSVPVLLHVQVTSDGDPLVMNRKE